MIVMNKSDLMKMSDLPQEKQDLLKTVGDIPILEMSTQNDEGVMEVKTEACERLLQYRVDAKLKTKKTENILSRLRVATPAPRDNKERPPCIPGKFELKVKIFL